jgi:hypothetical protein
MIKPNVLPPTSFDILMAVNHLVFPGHVDNLDSLKVTLDDFTYGTLETSDIVPVMVDSVKFTNNSSVQDMQVFTSTKSLQHQQSVTVTSGVTIGVTASMGVSSPFGSSSVSLNVQANFSTSEATSSTESFSWGGKHDN